MKYAFFAIVLANLVFFLWEMQQQRPLQTMSSQQASAAGEKQILLLSELSASPVLTSAKTRDETTAPPAERIHPPASPEDEVSAKIVAAGGLPQADDRAVDDGLTVAAAAQSGVAVDRQDAGLEAATSMAAELPDNATATDDDKRQTVFVASEQAETAASPQTVQPDDLSAEPELPTVSALGADDSAAENGHAGDRQQDSDAGQIEQSDVETPAIPENQMPTEIARAENAAPVTSAESKQEPEASEQTDSDGVDGEAAPAEEVCYEVGPFDDKRQLNGWIKTQHLDRKRTEAFYREQQVAYAFLVYYPAGETFQESKQNETMLKEKGISDLWLFRKGEMRGVISLGLFREKFRAEKLLQQLADDGVTAKMQERFRTEQAVYVRVRQPVIVNDSTQPFAAAACRKPPSDTPATGRPIDR